MDDNEICPRCKSSKYRNPAIQFMVNECGHILCMTCVDLAFPKGSGLCPSCGKDLRKANYILSLFGDALVEKDNIIRKKILKIYNKFEEDFDNLRDYNDYLEDIETIVFNLVRGIDIEETNLKIEQYKKENKEAIQKNKGKISKEDHMLKYTIEVEKETQESRTEEILQQQNDIKVAKAKRKQQLLDNLISSDMAASEILAKYSQNTFEPVKPVKTKKTNLFSSGITIGKADFFLPIPAKKKEMTYSYQSQQLDLVGPQGLNADSYEQFGFLQNVRKANGCQRAGGCITEYACGRALEDAYDYLYAN